MFSQRDPSIRGSGYATVLIKNLAESVDQEALQKIFSSYGTLFSCKVVINSDTQPKGYGFAQFEHEEEARKATVELNGMLVHGKEIYVALINGRQPNEIATFNNVYIKNLSKLVSKDDLTCIFKECGPISSAVVMTDADGNSRGFGFVCFEEAEHAASSVDRFNGHIHDGKAWYVGRALPKSEREAELRAKYEQQSNEQLKGANLYLKNLDKTYDDEKLRELFAEFGNITSCKVMLDAQGQSKCYGFVAFSLQNEANKAINEMNGKLLEGKPLYVAVAQRKEERRESLQAHFARIEASRAMTSTMPSAPAYLPPATRISLPQVPSAADYHFPAPMIASPQLPYSHQIAPILPPSGSNLQPQFLPRIQPSGTIPSFMMPHYQRHRQPGQRIISRQGGPQQMQQQHQQFFQNNANHGYMQNAHYGGPQQMQQQQEQNNANHGYMQNAHYGGPQQMQQQQQNNANHGYMQNAHYGGPQRMQQQQQQFFQNNASHGYMQNAHYGVEVYMMPRSMMVGPRMPFPIVTRASVIDSHPFPFQLQPPS